MKLLAAVGFILTLAIHVAAQDSLQHVQAELKKYKSWQATGISLTIIGAGMLIASDQMSNSVSIGDGGVARFMAVTLLGGGCLAGGIPLWVSGTHGVRRYRKRQESITLSVHSSRIGGSGLTLKYHL